MIRSFDGRTPAVAESAFVSEMAYLVGDVTLDERASVWPFVCCRGDREPTTVGAETNVQEFTMLHGATVGDGVTVGHGAVVDMATVGDGALVGMSSSVLTGASVGSGAVVAAGAVVREGREVPDGHMAYGVPAETRPLPDGLRARAEATTEAYVDLSRQFRATGGLDARDRDGAGPDAGR